MGRRCLMGRIGHEFRRLGKRERERVGVRDDQPGLPGAAAGEHRLGRIGHVLRRQDRHTHRPQVRDRITEDRCVDEGGAQRVERDTAFGDGGGDRPHQPHDGVLRRGIQGVERAGGDPREAGHDKNRPGSLCLEDVQGRLGSVDDTVEVDGDDVSIPLEVEVVDVRAGFADTGVQDGHVEAPEPVDGHGHGGVIVVEAGDIGVDEHAVDRVGDVLPGGIDVGDDDVGAARGEAAGDGGADPACRARDDGHLSCEVDHWCSLGSRARVARSKTFVISAMLTSMTRSRSGSRDS